MNCDYDFASIKNALKIKKAKKNFKTFFKKKRPFKFQKILNFKYDLKKFL